MPNMMRVVLLLCLATYASSSCVDARGRKGVIKTTGCSNQCTGGVCTAVGCLPSYWCAANPVPAWLDEAGRWRCNETFALEGGRFVWTDGLVAIEPQHCTPLFVDALSPPFGFRAGGE